MNAKKDSVEQQIKIDLEGEIPEIVAYSSEYPSQVNIPSSVIPQHFRGKLH